MPYAIRSPIEKDYDIDKFAWANGMFVESRRPPSTKKPAWAGGMFVEKSESPNPQIIPGGDLIFVIDNHPHPQLSPKGDLMFIANQRDANPQILPNRGKTFRG